MKDNRVKVQDETEEQCIGQEYEAFGNPADQSAKRILRF